MNNFKIGGKITLDDNTAYRIVDIVELDGKEYLFCCTNKKPIVPKILERKIIGEESFVKEEEDLVIIKKIALKMLGKK